MRRLVLTADQVALLAAIADRERTAVELAAALAERPVQIERRMRVLRRLGVAEARPDVCPLCRHVAGRRVYSPTVEGLRVLAESPLLRKAAAA